MKILETGDALTFNFRLEKNTELFTIVALSSFNFTDALEHFMQKDNNASRPMRQSLLDFVEELQANKFIIIVKNAGTIEFDSVSFDSWFNTTLYHYVNP